MENFNRTRMLLGEQAFEKLRRSRVAVVGLGGVGSYAVEALARCAIGYLRLVDCDVVKASNINRQLLALHSTIGISKTELAAKRVLDINPYAEVDCHNIFVDQFTASQVVQGPLDAIIDAIDSVSSKVELLYAAVKTGATVISCMGASAHINPMSIRVDDISKTRICKLASRIRKKLHKKGIYSGVSCVYSIEVPVDSAIRIGKFEDLGRGRPRKELGSISYLPGLFGLIAASQAISAILKLEF